MPNGYDCQATSNSLYRISNRLNLLEMRHETKLTLDGKEDLVLEATSRKMPLLEIVQN